MKYFQDVPGQAFNEGVPGPENGKQKVGKMQWTKMLRTWPCRCCIIKLPYLKNLALSDVILQSCSEALAII